MDLGRSSERVRGVGRRAREEAARGPAVVGVERGARGSKVVERRVREHVAPLSRDPGGLIGAAFRLGEVRFFRRAALGAVVA